jgi:hypothetical protein
VTASQAGGANTVHEAPPRRRELGTGRRGDRQAGLCFSQGRERFKNSPSEPSSAFQSRIVFAEAGSVSDLAF